MSILNEAKAIVAAYVAKHGPIPVRHGVAAGFNPHYEPRKFSREHRRKLKEAKRKAKQL